MSKVISLTLPLPRYKTKKTYPLFGLNAYRNIHYRVSAKAKIEATEIYAHGLQAYKHIRLDKIKITYTVYFSNKRKKDIDNFLSVFGKFFQDTLVKMGIIEDDNYYFIVEICYKFGGVGNDNVDIEIEELI